MAPPGIFRKKEKKIEPVQHEKKPPLLELCGDDSELYQVLTRTILMNPQLALKEELESYVQKAQSFESQGDKVRSRIAYETAGKISQFQGKLAQTQKFFKKAAEVEPTFVHKKVFEYYDNKENAEHALAVAREYYLKTGKLEEK